MASPAIRNSVDLIITYPRLEEARIPLLSLPTDLVHEILLRLKMKNILTCSSTCKHLYQATVYNDLWRRLYIRDFLPRYPYQDQSVSFYNAYKKNYKLIAKEKEAQCFSSCFCICS